MAPRGFLDSFGDLLARTIANYVMHKWKEYDRKKDRENWGRSGIRNIQKKKSVNHPLFNKIERTINNLPGITELQRSSMVGYYSQSKKTNKKMGLVWLQYPSKSNNKFMIHLRKENDNQYPKGIIDKLTNYKSSGLGDYPSVIIKNINDAEAVIELIKYAYNNL